jgi:hypothetical protein
MLLHECMLVISEQCTPLINEFETHHFKWNWTDQVEKSDDDALDSLRYFIFSYMRDVHLRDLSKRIRRLEVKKIKTVKY